ncbi:hypothetical protein EVAR_27029_1 [Eumeta japonica]|uniref:Uncharacterized protein n=1 Tax=Eumeta variegata TaxID=151549 RepID=A0A4C1WGS0_EUMVA|nr:hypothetical protein EVAR_27029_1 [Eumeta japonica]
MENNENIAQVHKATNGLDHVKYLNVGNPKHDARNSAVLKLATKEWQWRRRRALYLGIASLAGNSNRQSFVLYCNVRLVRPHRAARRSSVTPPHGAHVAYSFLLDWLTFTIVSPVLWPERLFFVL